MNDVTALVCFMTAGALAVCATVGCAVLFGCLAGLAIVAGAILLDETDQQP